MYISITKLSQTHHFWELFSKVLVRGLNYKLGIPKTQTFFVNRLLLVQLRKDLKLETIFHWLK